MRVWTGDIDRDHDLVVVGSGAGGLTAALRAARADATVAVLEKADYVGGTSAVSGGMIWVPRNRCMDELGIEDTREDALRYLERVAGRRSSDALLATLVDRGREMLAFVESESALRFRTLPGFPDYHAEWDGAHPGGRSLEPDLFDGGAMGPLLDALRPDHRPPFTMGEYEEWRIFTRFPWDMLAKRADDGYVARGRALVAPLLQACAEAGVTVATSLPVERLLTDGDARRVRGVRTAGRDVVADAVVLACGGFEWDETFCRQFLPGTIRGSCSPPHNTGDGLRMGASLGAALGNMSEAWWGPMVQLPGNTTDGAPTSTLLRFERTGPRSIIVDRHGRRFINEAENYNDVTKVFHDFDPHEYGPRHLPAHLVFDHGHLSEYGFLTHRVDKPTPEWLVEADTIEQLADRIGVDRRTLAATVDRFNAHAAEGHDPDWHRGEAAYDRYWGDQHAAHPCLGPLDEPPFYAMEVFTGVIGTKGGLVTDEHARVEDVYGAPVPGLYACGNTTAHPMGIGYAGAGSTLGPAMTMGFVAAEHASNL